MSSIPAFYLGLAIAFIISGLIAFCYRDYKKRFRDDFGDVAYRNLVDSETRVADRDEALAVIAELAHMIRAVKGTELTAGRQRAHALRNIEYLAAAACREEWDGDVERASFVLEVIAEFAHQQSGVQRRYTNGREI